MSAIGRAAALPPEPLISTLFGGRAAARPMVLLKKVGPQNFLGTDEKAPKGPGSPY